ncbi:unnamed protein product [Phyllotreta striolata]|uniref:Uncharacterized protein n=1 Tax=Phyllotreta striolata TaxID=444603 RepID=A0A9N9TTQ4_PHYSR|nr:unnamed protein product [Phyllotreta striolata]
MSETQTPSECPTCWPVPWRQYATKCICKPQCPTACPIPIEEPCGMEEKPSNAISQMAYPPRCTTPMSQYKPPPQFSEPPNQNTPPSYEPTFRPPQCFDQQQCQFDQFDQQQDSDCPDTSNYGASGQCQQPPMSQNEPPPVMCYMPRGPQNC